MCMWIGKRLFQLNRDSLFMTNTATYLLVIFSLVIGCFFPAQGVINTQLTRWLNHPLQGALVSFGFGTCLLIRSFFDKFQKHTLFDLMQLNIDVVAVEAKMELAKRM